MSSNLGGDHVRTRHDPDEDDEDGDADAEEFGGGEATADAQRDAVRLAARSEKKDRL